MGAFLSQEGTATGAGPAARVQRASTLPTWQALAQQGALGSAKTYDDRAIVFERDVPVEAAYFLAEGAIEIVQRGVSGTAIVVKILTAPALFCAIEPLAREPRTLETVRVLGGARAHAIAPDRFLDLCAREAKAGFECLVDTARAFSVAARFESARLADTEALLANLVCAYAEVFGAPVSEGLRIDVKRTQADFAEAIGANERSVNRVLAAWKDEGLVDKKDARYVVKDGAALRERAGDLMGSLVHGAASWE